MADGTLTHVQALKEGKTVKFRPQGGSMVPIIQSGQLVTVEPLNGRKPEVGDAVLCKVNGRRYLHKVTAIGSDGRYQISNNHGFVNGWTTLANIYGLLVAVEP